jgi:hypothetical protein
MANFSTDKTLVKYAKSFLRDRIQAFRKDMAICMTADTKGQHAYFPALMTCTAFLDFLSGLNAGKLHGHGIKDLLIYRNKFMDANRYQHIDLMYIMLRHKIAHLAYPYIVFDTATSTKYPLNPHRRVTWKVFASK